MEDKRAVVRLREWLTQRREKMAQWRNSTKQWVKEKHRLFKLLFSLFIWGILLYILDWACDLNVINTLLGVIKSMPYGTSQQSNTHKAITSHAVSFWQPLFYATTLIAGLPVALLLWHWRDKNVRDQIENARVQNENIQRDANLKEFREVALHAAGGLNEKLPEEAREQLQIAALHQLRGFLRGEHGESFKRPAAEIYLAGHEQAMHRIGVPTEQKDANNLSSMPEFQIKKDKITNKYKEEQNYIRKYIKRIKLKINTVDSVRIYIINKELPYIFHSQIKLSSRRFDFLNISNFSFPKNSDLSGSHFFGAVISDTDFNGAKLEKSHFEYARLNKVNVKNCNMRKALFNRAVIEGPYREERENFSGTNLTEVKFKYAYLCNLDYSESAFNKAFLQGANIEGEGLFADKMNMEGAKIDQDTLVHHRKVAKGEEWKSIRNEEIPPDMILSEDDLRKLGVVHVNDLKRS